MRIRIHVTEKAIRDAKHSSCTQCPVAISINRKLRDGFYTTVGGRCFAIVSATTSATIMKHELPGNAKQLVLAFDKRQEVKPIAFMLEIPSFYLKESNAKNRVERTTV